MFLLQSQVAFRKFSFPFLTSKTQDDFFSMQSYTTVFTLEIITRNRQVEINRLIDFTSMVNLERAPAVLWISDGENHQTRSKEPWS